MQKSYYLRVLITFLFMTAFLSVHADEWPDGTKMDTWFNDTAKIDVATLGKEYIITDYGVVLDSNKIQTEAIQSVIDRCSAEGGGVVVIPRGTFLSGSLFFKPGTHLHLVDGAVLKGSNRIANFPVMTTRFEGETCQYFAALVNADNVDGFSITGNGTINGNGHNYWEEFWIRRKWNPQCTNKDEQRPRLVYISNSKNVTVQDVHLVNSPVWTNHLYKCDHVRYLDCYIYAPTTGIKAPSSDALDIDGGHDILVSGCYISVNDDGVCIKGGKGTFADTMTVNGPVSRVLVENCTFGTVHSMLTLGSESLNDKDIVLRNCHAINAYCILHLKMRPDTPQRYEYVTVNGITGKTLSGLRIRPWSQFYNKLERKDMPMSSCSNITMMNIKMDCTNFFDIAKSDKYDMEDFTFSNINITNKGDGLDKRMIKGVKLKKVIVNGIRIL